MFIISRELGPLKLAPNIRQSEYARQKKIVGVCKSSGKVISVLGKHFTHHPHNWIGLLSDLVTEHTIFVT